MYFNNCMPYSPSKYFITVRVTDPKYLEIIEKWKEKCYGEGGFGSVTRRILFLIKQDLENP